jgi:hypothetical protein
MMPEVMGVQTYVLPYGVLVPARPTPGIEPVVGNILARYRPPCFLRGFFYSFLVPQLFSLVVN